MVDIKSGPVAPVGSFGTKFAGLKGLIDGRLALGLRSEFLRYGLRRDITVPHANPPAKIPISIRLLEDRDVPLILPERAPELDPRERVLIAWRRSFLKKVPQGCHVAIDERNGKPCYMQWLLPASKNDLILSLGGFPALGPRESLLENAFTPVEYRGLGIMSAAMALIAERAVIYDATHVLTFVGDDNIASLKGCQKAGFNPHLINRRVQLLWGTLNRNTFEVMADDDPRRTQKF